MDLEPVREGKAHSTSELPRTPVKRSHTRSSSDSTRKLSLSARAGVRPLSSGSQTKFGTETQANVVTFTEASADVQTDQMSPQVVNDVDEGRECAGEAEADCVDNSGSDNVPAASPHSNDLGYDTITAAELPHGSVPTESPVRLNSAKTYRPHSLSLGQATISTTEKEEPLPGSLSSQMSSADSAISKSPLSTGDGSDAVEIVPDSPSTATPHRILNRGQVSL